MLAKAKKWWSRKLLGRGFSPNLSLQSSPRPQTKFVEHVKSNTITLPSHDLFDADDVFFTMGSCFAEEVRIALKKRGLKCVPDYKNIQFDSAEAVVDELPKREHMNFYNSFTVLQQFQQILGDWQQNNDDFWLINKRIKPPTWGQECYQDPYRRLVMAKSPDVLNDVLDQINAEMLAGFHAATAFVFTFGMTEVFINKTSGKVAAQKPLYAGAGGAKETVMHASSFQENYDNVVELVRLIRKHKPDAPIILTVSPVPLARTFQAADVITISTEGKSILRAVLGQVCREMEGVYYLPSYEFVMARGAANFEPDRRHVRRDTVDQIVQSFVASFFAGDQNASTQPKSDAD